MKAFLSQLRHHVTAFWRRPAAAFFTVAMPLILLFVFATAFGNDPIKALGVRTAQFYAPALASFGAATAAYAYLCVSTVSLRETGVLKRLRATPLPVGIFVAARVSAASAIAFTAAGLLFFAGAAFYGLQLSPARLPALLLVLTTGVLSFSALGLALASVCRTTEMAQALSNASLLPLGFISEVFIRPGRAIPGWLETIADILPLKHFARAVGGAFNPTLSGSGFAWGGEHVYAMAPDLAIMAAWGVFGAVFAARYFRWEPLAVQA